jgi:cation diffusion facilitator family transporter
MSGGSPTHAEGIDGPGSAKGHGHSQGAVDPAVFASARGIWATAAVQVAVVIPTGSVALLAETPCIISATPPPPVTLWIAFSVTRRMPTRRFSYGYGRAEDLAGLFIVFVILGSGIFAAYQSITHISDPPVIDFFWAVVGAGLVGFLGNEAVALFRLKIGREISSAALVADGYHARVDGLTNLAVLLGAIGVWLGYPMADPIVGLVISLAIFKIVASSAKSVVARLLDGVEPEVVDEARATSHGAPGVGNVSEVLVRWLGHRLRAEVNISVPSDITVAAGHRIAENVQHELLHRLSYLSSATIHVDPPESSGEEHHPNAAEHQGSGKSVGQGHPHSAEHDDGHDGGHGPGGTGHRHTH